MQARDCKVKKENSYLGCLIIHKYWILSFIIVVLCVNSNGFFVFSRKFEGLKTQPLGNLRWGSFQETQEVSFSLSPIKFIF